VIAQHASQLLAFLHTCIVPEAVGVARVERAPAGYDLSLLAGQLCLVLHCLVYELRQPAKGIRLLLSTGSRAIASTGQPGCNRDPRRLRSSAQAGP
jgi:hypothetical protein